MRKWKVTTQQHHSARYVNARGPRAVMNVIMEEGETAREALERTATALEARAADYLYRARNCRAAAEYAP